MLKVEVHYSDHAVPSVLMDGSTRSRNLQIDASLG